MAAGMLPLSGKSTSVSAGGGWTGGGTAPVKARASRASHTPAIGQPFNPYRKFRGAFIPEGVCKYKGISPGAKLVYGRLFRFAGKNGHAYPTVARLANETGIGPTQTRKYLRELKDANFIRDAGTHYRKDGSGGPTVYVFLWHAAFEGQVGPARRNIPPPPRKTEGVPLRTSEALTPSGNRGQRESVHHQESVYKNQFGGASEKVAVVVGKPKAIARSSKSKRADDEKPERRSQPGQQATFANPVDELRDIYRRKTGNEISPDVERRIWETVEIRGVLRKDFIEQVRPHVSNPWKNPAGFLTNFARKFGSVATPEPVPAAPEPPLNEKGRCSLCNGLGMNSETGYCGCRMGRDLEKAEAARKRQSAQSAGPKGASGLQDAGMPGFLALHSM